MLQRETMKKQQGREEKLGSKCFTLNAETQKYINIVHMFPPLPVPLHSFKEGDNSTGKNPVSHLFPKPKDIVILILPGFT